jgi:hypothetical protein
MTRRAWVLLAILVSTGPTLPTFAQTAPTASGPAAVTTTPQPKRRHTPPTGLEADLSDYRWQDFAAHTQLSQNEIATLERQKLVVTDRTCPQVFSGYISKSLPLFITSDSLLNAFHVLFEESVLRLEAANAPKLHQRLGLMWKNLPAIEMKLKGSPHIIAGAKRRARIVVGVALQLLGDDSLQADPETAALIATEVKRVEAAADREKPAWLGKSDTGFLAIDYTRFRVRGFYTRTKFLERYFRARAWLQAIPFRIANDEELLAMMLLGRAVGNLEYDDMLGVYERLLGPADDWSLRRVAVDIGDAPLDPQEVAEQRKELLDTFRYNGAPQINDQLAFWPENATAPLEPTLRVLPALRTPDAVLFGLTTDPRKFQRDYPSGLEVAALLGSSIARAQLEKPVVNIIDNYHGLLSGNGCYEQYMRCLSELLKDPEKDVPALFGSEAWKIKSCQTVLGGWAQMRHTWVLQAKENEHYLGLTRQPSGFVEPCPEFYAAMADMIRSMRQDFEAAGAFEPSAVELVELLQVGIPLVKQQAAAERKHEESITGIENYEKLQNTLMVGYGLIDKPDPKSGEYHYPPTAQECLPALQKLADDLEQGRGPTGPALVSLLQDGHIALAPLWDQLERVSLDLRAMAHKQLRHIPFNNSEDTFIKHYGETLGTIMFYRGNSYESPNDDAPRVVDVFANPQQGGVLEVGIARPRLMYLLYPYLGRDVLCVGTVLPYFEFTNPHRLTDTEWCQRQDGPNAVSIPQWSAPIYSFPETKHGTLPKSD